MDQEAPVQVPEKAPQEKTDNIGKSKNAIKTSTGLIAIFAAVALFFGGALTYWTYNDPNSYSSSINSTVVSTKTTEDAATVDWATYTNTNYGFSFKYPKEWESTKVETTSDTAQGEYGTDIVLKVSFYDPANKKLIDCANNEYQNWSDKTPTKTECDPILSALTKAEKDKLVGPRMPKNIYVRVYKDDSSLVLKDWLYKKFHKPDTNLSEYQVGKEIELGVIKGYQSSIGCCASADNNYVIKANGYILSLGTNYFDDNLSDTNMPVIFRQIAGTFKITDPTADWKTYTNDTYGFSLKFPSEWPVEEEKLTDPTPLMVNFMPTWLKNTDAPYSIDIDTRGLQFKVDAISNSLSPQPNYQKTSVTFAGKDATQITYTQTNIYKTVIFQVGNDTFVISGIDKDNTKKDGKDLGKFEQISNSFHFTK